MESITAKERRLQLQLESHDDEKPKPKPSSIGTATTMTNRQKRKLAYRARHRLFSILSDSSSLQKRVISTLLLHNKKYNCNLGYSSSSSSSSIDEDAIFKDWPWIPNKNCGSWYLPPSPSPSSISSSSSSSSSVYFKSTDGHKNTWSFSLKRLNLNILQIMHGKGVDGCFVVDSSVRKTLPDSFSRTVPIWACVLNRIVQKYRSDFDEDSNGDDKNKSSYRYWNTDLFTPADIVSKEEHNLISNLIDSRVDMLYKSKAIVDPKRLCQIMTKPIRAIWISNGTTIIDNNNNNSNTTTTTTTILEDSSSDRSSNKFFTIVCCNPSSYIVHDNDNVNGDNDNNKVTPKSHHHIRWIDDGGGNGDNRDDGEGASPYSFYYTPGAGDDEDTWARNLTPELFWKYKEKILANSLTEDDTDSVIESIVKQEQQQQPNATTTTSTTTTFNRIGNTLLYIGSRRSGKPPNCWDNFDAILNVTENQYDNMEESIIVQEQQHQRQCFYLQLFVKEGKRDKTELERLMPVGLLFLIHHLRHKGRRVLVHCAQGKDRSVALALAFVVICCPLTYPLGYCHNTIGEENKAWNVNTLLLSVQKKILEEEGEVDQSHHNNSLYLQSGIDGELIKALLLSDQDHATTTAAATGKEIFLNWAHKQKKLPSNIPLANKESLRIALHLIQQDREVAEPTRSTMQKINRFFMSGSQYR